MKEKRLVKGGQGRTTDEVIARGWGALVQMALLGLLGLIVVLSLL